MAQTGRSNVRYVDPQRRYTVMLGPSWNAPIGALPHDDRAGTHDSADGRCGSYASIGGGQAALWITSKDFCRSSERVPHCNKIASPIGRHELASAGSHSFARRTHSITSSARASTFYQLLKPKLSRWRLAPDNDRDNIPLICGRTPIAVQQKLPLGHASPFRDGLCLAIDR